MKRKIKFRGFSIHENDWVYGYFGGKINTYTAEDEPFIIQPTYNAATDRSYFTDIAIKKDTEGQYTGLKDKNGKEIYEGDIVKFHYFFLGGGEEGVWESEHQAIGVLTWGLYGWAVSSIRGEHWQGYTGYDAGEGESNILELMMMNESSIHEESFEIIGNIYENPELL